MLKRALIPLSLLIAALAACNGSDDGPADPVAGFEGSWASGCYTENDTLYRYKDNVTLKRNANAGLSYTGALSMYSNATCTGTPDDVAEYSGAVSFAGAKAIGTASATRAQITPSEQEAIKTVFLLQGGELYVGSKPSAADAEGYPTALETGYRFARSQ